MLDGDIDALRKVDKRTVQALELRAPGSSTTDAETIKRQLQAAEIFSAFSDQERSEILNRLLQCRGLIPSLRAFFRNLCYWEACVDSMRHLVTPRCRDTILTALEGHFTGINQQEGQVVIQVNESNFTTTRGSTADQMEFGCRHLVAFAMRRYRDIPRAPVREDVLSKARPTADRAVLRQYAELATRLGFESPEIDDLMMTPQIPVSQALQPQTTPPLVTSGRGEDIEQRCGLPKLAAFEEDRDSLFVHHLDDERDECGEGITSFFVRRWVYLDFLGRPRGTVRLASAAGEQEGQEHAQQNQAQVQREREAQEREVQEREEQAQREQEAREREAREREEQAQREREAREREAREREAREREEQAQREREAREREEQAQREREAREREAQEREEQAQREQAQREQAQREREEREREAQEREEQAQREQEAREQEAREREAQEREEQAQREQEAREREQREGREREAEERREREDRERVCICFKIREGNGWRYVQSLLVSRSDPSEVARVAKKSIRKGLRIFDTNMRLLGPDDCYEVVTADGTNTILLVPQAALDINNQLLDSASILSYEAIVDSTKRPRRY